MVAISSWRCFLCDEMTTIRAGTSGEYTFMQVKGKWRPVHYRLDSDCSAQRPPSIKISRKKPKKLRIALRRNAIMKGKRGSIRIAKRKDRK